MSLDKCMHPCSHDSSEDKNVSLFLENSSAPLFSQFPLLPHQHLLIFINIVYKTMPGGSVCILGCMLSSISCILYFTDVSAFVKSSFGVSPILKNWLPFYYWFEEFFIRYVVNIFPPVSDLPNHFSNGAFWQIKIFDEVLWFFSAARWIVALQFSCPSWGLLSG